MLSSWWSLRMLLLLVLACCTVSCIQCNDQDVTTTGRRMLNSATNHSELPSSLSLPQSSHSSRTLGSAILSSSTLHEYIITHLDYSLINSDAKYQAYAEQDSYGASETYVVLPPYDFPSLCGSSVSNNTHLQIKKYVEDAGSSFTTDGIYNHSFDYTLLLNEVNCPISEIVENAKKLNEMTRFAGAVIRFLLLPMNIINNKDNEQTIHDGPTIPPTNINSNDIDVGILFVPENAMRLLQIRFSESTSQDATGQSNPFYLDSFNDTVQFVVNIKYMKSCETEACYDEDPGGYMFLKYLGILSVLALFCIPVVFLVRNQHVPTLPQSVHSPTSGTDHTIHDPLTEEEFDALPKLFYQSKVSYCARRIHQKNTNETKMLNQERNGMIEDTNNNTSTSIRNEVSECKKSSSHAASCDTPAPEKTHDIETTIVSISNNQTLPSTQVATLSSIENGTDPQYLTNTTATSLNLITSSTTIDPESNEICPICVETFQENEIVRVLPRCQHLYHNHCIREWLLERQSSFCPTCKVNVKKEKEDATT